MRPELRGAAAEGFGAGGKLWPDERLAERRACRAGETDHGQLHGTMGENEPDEPMRETVLVGKCRQAAQHESIEGNHVDRTEAEENPGAEGSQRHHDVVGEKCAPTGAPAERC